MRSSCLLVALSVLTLTACSALSEPAPILVTAELIPSQRAAAAPAAPVAAPQPMVDDDAPPPQGG